MKIKWVPGLLLFILIISLLPVACATSSSTPAQTSTAAKSAKAEPIVLKAVGFLASPALGLYDLELWAKRVTENSNGELVIQYTGGPEIIPMSEQVQAVRNGVIDINGNTPSFFREVPEANVEFVSNLTVKDEQEWPHCLSGRTIQEQI